MQRSDTIIQIVQNGKHHHPHAEGRWKYLAQQHRHQFTFRVCLYTMVSEEKCYAVEDHADRFFGLFTWDGSQSIVAVPDFGALSCAELAIKFAQSLMEYSVAIKLPSLRWAEVEDGEAWRSHCFRQYRDEE